MDHRIEKMNAFRIVGVKLRSTNEKMQGMKDIPAFWSELTSQNKQMEILALMDSSPMGLLGVSVYNSDSNDDKVFDYYIGCASTKEKPVGMEEYLVPTVTWAIFPCKKDNMNEVQIKIFTDWMPTSGYQALNSGYETGEMKSHAPDIELYTQGDDTEIWVPVKKI